MLHDDEILEIEKKMRAEHARDLEALEAVKRLRKYLPKGDTPIKSETVTPAPPRMNGRPTGRSGLTEVIRNIVRAQDPTYRWTRASIEEALDTRKFEVRAKDKVAAINQSLRTLVSSGELRLISQGSGSAPSVYGSPEREGAALKPLTSHRQGPQTGRKEQLAQFLLTHGPTSRVDIVLKAGLPEGTVSYCLNDERFFEQVEGRNWNLTAFSRRGLARAAQLEESTSSETGGEG